jgi:hypothetical protein
MNRSSFALPVRAVVHGLRLVALAGCLVAGAGLTHAVAQAQSSRTSPIPIAGPCGTYARHDVVSASGRNAYVFVSGTCFPFLSTATITVRDLTQGTVLANAVPVRVSILGGFAYQVQGAAPNDRVRVRVSDHGWHKVLTITVQDFIP